MSKIPSVLMLLLFPFISIFAEDNTDTAMIKQYYLNEVTVVSPKENQLLEKLPVASTSFSTRKLEMQDIRTTKELTSKVPNLFMPDYGSKINSPIYIRGIGSKVNAPSVGLYIDGMPYFEKSTYDIDLSDVEQVEILRGPQGTLYGRNTMGGIINIYTKSPFDFQGTRIDLSGGNYGNYSTKISNYSRLTDKLGLVISGNYLHKDGFFENTVREENTDMMDDEGARFKLSYKPTKSLLIELFGGLTHSNQYGYAYGQTDSTGKPGNVHYNQKSGYEQSVTTNGLNIRYDPGNMLLTSTTSYQWYEDNQSIDQDFTPDSVYFAVQETRQNMVSQELTLRSKSPSNYQWVVGIFGFHQAIRKIADIDYHKSKYTTDKHYITNTKGVAIYHQSTYNNLFIEGLSAGTGIRFDLENTTQDFKPYKINASGTTTLTPYNSELDFSEILPKFNLMYQFNNQHKIYTSVTKGYKTGGFNDAFQKDPDRTFDPESSWNYELGYQFSLLDKMLTGDFTLFYIDWEDQQINYIDPSYSPQVPIIKNSGKSESNGVELGLSAHPTDKLDVDLQYGYTQAVFKEYKKDAKNDFSGNYIPYIPKNTFSLTANYSIPIYKIIDRMVLMGQYNGIGSLYWEEANKYKQNYYGLFNARCTLYKGNQSISIWGRNLSGTDYNAYMFTSGAREFSQEGKPMTFGVDLTIFL